MKLAIGDVVRGHDDTDLGVVAGVVNQGASCLVMVEVPGGMRRLAAPGALVVVARSVRPTTPVQGVVGLIAVIIGLLAAYIGCRSAQELGADWLLTVLSGLGGYTLVMTAHQCWVTLTGPRRFRV
ncbi:hypothetical protein ACH4UT_28630 [Streptomyces sp. NPDC020799]|uniref:hypothetical protein n=1 Tax=unclassified Streptomyces TaxID=2593676 RepID=UPI0033D788FD